MFQATAWYLQQQALIASSMNMELKFKTTVCIALWVPGKQMWQPLKQAWSGGLIWVFLPFQLAAAGFYHGDSWAVFPEAFSELLCCCRVCCLCTSSFSSWFWDWVPKIKTIVCGFSKCLRHLCSMWYQILPVLEFWLLPSFMFCKQYRLCPARVLLLVSVRRIQIE